MTFLEVYFIKWYLKVTYFGNLAYSIFLLIWIFAISYELRRTVKMRKNIDTLSLYNADARRQHYTNIIVKLAIMLLIVLLEMALTGLCLMDELYIPINFSLYGNKSDIAQTNTLNTTVLDCISRDNFVGLGVGVFSVKITIYLYIVWTYCLCLNYFSMVYGDKMDCRKLCKYTLLRIVLSTSVITLMMSKYTIILGLLSYTLMITTAVVYLVISQKRLIRNIRAKRFEVNLERPKSRIKRLDKELNYLRKMGGFIIAVGVIRFVSVFFCDSIGEVIIPILRNPCWLEYVHGFENIYPQIDWVTSMLAQVVFSVGKIINGVYVLLVVSLNVLVICVSYYVQRKQLKKIVEKKYTTYGVPLTRRLLD